MIETPFLDRKDLWLEENELAFAFDNGFPVAKGHRLIIPKRVVITPDEMTDDEMLAVFHLMKSQKTALTKLYNPDGFTWGWNDGEAAGQSVAHVHLHLIPRYDRDVKIARGGICRVFDDLPDYYNS